MSTEKLLSKIEKIITNRRNIEDFSYEVQKNGMVKFKWTVNNSQHKCWSLRLCI